MNPFRGTLVLGLAWLLIVGAVYLVFVGWSDREANPNRALTVSPAGEIVLQRNRAGHFVADGEINGRAVTFLLDTGATQVALPMPLARSLNLKLGPPMSLQTAAGPAVGYPVRLERVRLGHIEMRELSAIVSERLDPELVLLGMNFLRRLEMTQRGEHLILKPLPSAR